jgi:hypothetical protein
MSDEELLTHLSGGLKKTDFAWEEYRHRMQQLEDHVMTVGFHKGKKISEVPMESLEKELTLSATDNWIEDTCYWRLQKYARLLFDIKKQ